MRILKITMTVLLSIIVLLTLITVVIFQQKSFGKNPSGKHFEKIKKSPNYRDGSFKNLTETPTMAANTSYWQLLKEYFNKKQNTEPLSKIPSVKTDLKAPAPSEPSIIWFGHSSYFIQIDGLKILVDPVFSERTSPVQFAGSKNYLGTSVYSVDDFPEIDLLVLSHDHYDHLDYESIGKLISKTKKFITPLGVGSHLEFWGVPSSKISEFDWWEETDIAKDIKIAITPGRHFSGRGMFNRNQTLWASFALITPTHRLFLGGDSGYDTHFKDIGEKYGPFDIAMLESGQYNEMWPYIHMMPEQTVQAAIDLKSKVLFPVHWGKFTLALHAWDEPVNRVIKQAQKLNLKVTTPMIGERVLLDSIYPSSQWWNLNKEVEELSLVK